MLVCQKKIIYVWVVDLKVLCFWKGIIVGEQKTNSDRPLGKSVVPVVPLFSELFLVEPNCFSWPMDAMAQQHNPNKNNSLGMTKYTNFNP